MTAIIEADLFYTARPYATVMFEGTKYICLERICYHVGVSKEYAYGISKGGVSV